ncbi:hypothetical protein [Enterococcus sp. AZ050]|uniref:hypothetical protein n=1 Tax=Enterococcus sp. AZ050 TaxID=2774696 RepID=UPI003F23E37E
MKKVILEFLAVSMVIFSLLGVKSAYAANNISEDTVVQYDRSITEPKMLKDTFDIVSPRVQVFKFSILFPVGMYPPKTWQTLAYLGHLERVTYVGGGQYIGHYTTGW